MSNEYEGQVFDANGKIKWEDVPVEQIKFSNRHVQELELLSHLTQ